MIKPSRRLASKLAVGEHNRWLAEEEEAEAAMEEDYRKSIAEAEKLFPFPKPKEKTWFERLFGL